MMTKEERRRYQQEYRKQNGNLCTKQYEKTKQGFLVRLYRNMLSRISGVQKQKHHLYEGKALLPKEEFYEWALKQEAFHTLWDAWEQAQHPRKQTPSVDRKDSTKGYEPSNMEWVTHSENSRRGAVQRHKKDTCNS